MSSDRGAQRAPVSAWETAARHMAGVLQGYTADELKAGKIHQINSPAFDEAHEQLWAAINNPPVTTEGK